MKTMLAALFPLFLLVSCASSPEHVAAPGPPQWTLTLDSSPAGAVVQAISNGPGGQAFRTIGSTPLTIDWAPASERETMKLQYGDHQAVIIPQDAYIMVDFEAEPISAVGAELVHAK